MKNATPPITPVVVRQVRVRGRATTDDGDGAPAAAPPPVVAAAPPPADPMAAEPMGAAGQMPAMYAMTGERLQEHPSQMQQQPAPPYYSPTPGEQQYQQGPPPGGYQASSNAAPNQGFYQEPDDPNKGIIGGDGGAAAVAASSSGNRKRNMWIMIAVGVVVIVAAVIGVAVAVAGGGGSGDATGVDRGLPDGGDEDPAPTPSGDDPVEPAETPSPSASLTPSPTEPPTLLTVEETFAPTNNLFATASPTTSPTDPITCKAERDVYWDCVNNDLTDFAGSFCDTCIVDLFNNKASRESCAAFTDDFCALSPDCNCGVCLPAFRNYGDCLLGSGTGCLGTCPGPTDPPQPEPTSSPTKKDDAEPPATVPPTTPCQSLTTAYQQCLNTLPQAQVQECIDCANEVIRTVPRTNCPVFVKGFCQGFNSCNCGWCVDEMLEWADCAIDGDQCTIDCTDVPDATDPPAPPPTDPPQPCATEIQAYETCTAGLGSALESSCINCVNSALSLAPRNTCDAFNQGFCPAFGTCTDCGQCTQAFEDWVDCSLGPSCTVDCEGGGGTTPATKPPTPAPKPPTEPPAPPETDPPAPQCNFEEASYQACLSNRLSAADAQACVTCTNDALSTEERLCSTFNRDFCGDFSTCSSCGVCGDLIVGWVDCQVGGPNCDVDCDLNFSPPPASSPTAPPASSPTATEPPNEDRCTTELGIYSLCLVQNVASANQQACATCVNTAADNSRTDNCNVFEEDFCAGLESCSACGTCLDEATEYIDCVVSDGDCGFDCDATDPPAPDCTSEEASYQMCFNFLGSTRAQACANCYNAILPTLSSAGTCTELANIFCPALANCDCGTCGDELTSFLDCGLTSCSLTCS